jgi:tight adherence protein C
MLHNPPGPTILGFDVILIGTILTAVAAIAIMMAIYAAVTVRDPMAKRVKALNERREHLKAGIVVGSARKRASLVRKTETTDKLRDTLSRFKVLQDSQLKQVQKMLAQAGIRKKELAFFVIFARLVLPILLGTIAGLSVYVFKAFPDWSSLKKFMFFAGAVGLGYKAPEIFISNLISKRTAAIRKGLPDALDLLVICAEAAYPELGDEFALTSIEMAFLTERRQAFENLSYRVNLESVKGVVTTMIQTERYGTPLASALRVLSAEFRNERMMRAEEKAARLPAIMTVPLILFILPVLFVVILGPAACQINDSFINPTTKE